MLMLKHFAAKMFKAFHNYFDGPNKISDLYLAKFLDTLAKPFFPCNINKFFFFAKIQFNALL